jgi:hypothetical protein
MSRSKNKSRVAKRRARNPKGKFLTKEKGKEQLMDQIKSSPNELTQEEQEALRNESAELNQYGVGQYAGGQPTSEIPDPTLPPNQEQDLREMKEETEIPQDTESSAIPAEPWTLPKNLVIHQDTEPAHTQPHLAEEKKEVQTLKSETQESETTSPQPPEPSSSSPESPDDPVKDAFKRYVLENVDENFVLAQMGQILSNSATIPHIDHWTSAVRVDMPKLVYQIIMFPGYIDEVWSTLKVVMGTSLTNTQWSTSVLITLAFYDATRRIGRLHLLKT